MQEHIKNNPDKDMVLLLVPVERLTAQSNNYYNPQPYTTAINNYLLPSGVKLLKTKEATKIVITTTEYK